MDKLKPNLFIVGAPKCGTTSMWYYLSQHPEIFMVPGKEPQYFNTDLEFLKRPNEAEYLNLFARANSNHKYLGEASPLYMMSKVAASNIKRFNKESKIIIMVRNPAEVIFSSYLQNRVNQIEGEKRFEVALNLENERRKTLPKTIQGQPVERLFYSQFPKYEEQIMRYIDQFGMNSIHFILYDDLRNDTQKEVLKVFDFLGVNSTLDINYQTQNEAKKNRSIIIQNIIDNPPNWLRRPLRLIFSGRLRSKIYWFIWWSNKKKNNSSLSSKLKNQLNNKYISDICFIEKLLAINLYEWKS